MRAAIIDLGTNTFKLLVAEQLPGATGGLRVVHAEEVFVFLGRGGIEHGLLTEEAMARGMEALRKLSAKARALGAVQVRGMGTSALRNARNGDVFTARALAELGLPINIIPGTEEAGLVLEGVRQAVPFGKKPMLVMDIGGGSTEFILATDKALMWKHSFEIGTTRLVERFPQLDPMGLDTQLRMAEHIDAQFGLLWSVIDGHWPATLVGAAGSFNTIAAMIAHAQGTGIPDGTVELGLDIQAFDALKDRLFTLRRAERLALPGLPPDRVDTIIPAMMLIERVLLHGIAAIHWSRYSLKEGAAARLLG